MLTQIVMAVIHVSLSLGVPSDYMCKIAKLESNWKPNASNAIGARGLFQITKPTEKLLKEKYGVSGDIFDPTLNTKLASLLTLEHTKFLKRKGIEANYLNLYIIHFFGLPRGYKFLTTKDSEIVRNVFQKEYNANKSFIGNSTVAEFKEKIQRKLDKAKSCGEIINGK